MADEGTRGDDDDTQQQVFMLRLGYQEYYRDDIEECQRVIDLANANLIVETRAQIMDQTCHEQADEEDKDQDVGKTEGGIVEGELEVTQRYKMLQQGLEITLIAPEDPCQQAPVGQQNAQQGCQESASRQGEDKEHHHDPVDGDKPEGMDFHQTAETEEDERVEGEAHGLLVLIGLKEGE